LAAGVLKSNQNLLVIPAIFGFNLIFFIVKFCLFLGGGQSKREIFFKKITERTHKETHTIRTKPTTIKSNPNQGFSFAN
jgi:hypothetical protein